MPRENRKSKEKSVRLSQTAGVESTQKSKKAVKRNSTARIVGSLTLVALMVAAIVSMIWLFKAVIEPYLRPPVEIIEVDLSLYQKTPEDDRSKVAYYVVGLLGEDGSANTEAISLLCYDKSKGTLDFLQMPQDTYLGEESAIKRLDAVWGNPVPLDWCDHYECRRKLDEDEIADGKHTKCGTEVTQKSGSPAGDLCTVFNEMLGLPVDEYFMFQQKSLVKLVDLLEGIEVQIDEDMEVGGIKYKKGVQTITGEAALYYCTNIGKGQQGDAERMVRSRRIMAALFQELTAQSEDQLLKGSIGAIMNGSTPIRTEMSRENMVKLILSMKDIKQENITAYVMPGQSAKEGETYFSANRAELLTLINTSFRPVGAKVTDQTMKIPQIGTIGDVDLRKQTFSEVVAGD